MIKAKLCLCIVSFMLLLPGCGGGGTGNAVPLPMNTAIVLSAALKPGRTAVPIKAIAVSFSLPGVASPIRNQDGSLVVGFTGLYNFKSNGQIFPDSVSYDAASGTVNFTIVANDIATTDLGTGEIARLTYETPTGAQLSAQDIHNLVFKVSGPGSAVLSDDIEPSVRPVTYQKP